MSEQRGTFWCRIGERSPWWNRGLMTREEALAAAAEVLSPPKKLSDGTHKPGVGYGFVTVTTPSADPPNQLPPVVLGGDVAGLYGPWAPASEADPAIVAAVGRRASIKAIAGALVSANHPGGRMTQAVLRGHLRRLGYKRLPKTKQHTSERWGR